MSGGYQACSRCDSGPRSIYGMCFSCFYEVEDERHRFAKMVAASGVSNADFHAALADFDNAEYPKYGPGNPDWERDRQREDDRQETDTDEVVS